MADPDFTTRYFIKANGLTDWIEVTLEKFIDYEHHCGFRSKTPGRPATGGFSSGTISGATTYDGSVPKH